MADYRGAHSPGTPSRQPFSGELKVHTRLPQTKPHVWCLLKFFTALKEFDVSSAWRPHPVKVDSSGYRRTNSVRLQEEIARERCTCPRHRHHLRVSSTLRVTGILSALRTHLHDRHACAGDLSVTHATSRDNRKATKADGHG